MKRNYSKYLIEFQEIYGMDNTTIAKAIGVTPQAVSHWKVGRHTPSRLIRERLNKFILNYKREQETMNTPQTTTNENTTNTVVYLDSRLVAEMAGKNHKDLLRDIREYNSYLQSAILRPTDFWVEDTYKGRNGKTLPCYQISKKGCEFIQHKMTGQKGAIFTAKYINAFHDMGEHQALLPQPQPQQPTDDLSYLKSKMIDLYNSASTLEELHEGLHQINNVLIALHNARVTLVAKD